MKKIILILALIFINSSILPAFAAKNSGVGNQNTNTGQQVQQPSVTPKGNQVQNQNQVQTQNQGEDSQLQVNTQEQENLNEGQGEGLTNRNENATQNMSNVAEKVQELLQANPSGGIGEQVRQIAQEQNQAQNQIQQQLNKLDSKGKLARLLTGTDYKAVNNLKMQLEQNQIRIEQLTQMQNQVNNQGDVTMIHETIQALIQQNTSLQERITEEEKQGGLFGWLFRFFNK